MSLTIRSFSVISWTLVGGVLLLYRGAVSVFYHPSWQGNHILEDEHYSNARIAKVFDIDPWKLIGLSSELINVWGGSQKGVDKHGEDWKLYSRDLKVDNMKWK